MNIGALEILLLILVVFILFGAGKLPSVMADLGKGIKSFRKGMEAEENESPEPQSDPQQDSQTDTVASTEPPKEPGERKDTRSGTDTTDTSSPS